MLLSTLRSCDNLSGAREGRWAYQHGGDFGNDGGVTNWWPKPSVFPSGLTDWLGLPLSLYSSSYSGDNIYLGEYDWKVDSLKHALPVDRRFYDDIFRNASFGKPRDDPRRTGIRMFEQDFLCSINGHTQLTNQDVVTGQRWFQVIPPVPSLFTLLAISCPSPPFSPVFCAVSPSRRDGQMSSKTEPRAKKQWHEDQEGS